jgi:uncharacterized protein YndB with AHSA1/START domain
VSERTTLHDTFVVERTYDASPARVFAAWATPEAKSRWFGGPDDWETTNYELDFRVGGRETNVVRQPNGGPAYTYNATYADIVPNERIAYTYTMDVDQTRMSASVTTVELKPAGTGTRLVFTESGAYFDGTDKPEFRIEGTESLLASLDAALRETAAPHA